MKVQRQDGTWFDDQSYMITTPASSPPRYCTHEGNVLLDGYENLTPSRFDAFSGLEIKNAGHPIRYCPDQDPANLHPRHDVWALIFDQWIKR